MFHKFALIVEQYEFSCINVLFCSFTILNVVTVTKAVTEELITQSKQNDHFRFLYQLCCIVTQQHDYGLTDLQKQEHRFLQCFFYLFLLCFLSRKKGISSNVLTVTRMRLARRSLEKACLGSGSRPSRPCPACMISHPQP